MNNLENQTSAVKKVFITRQIPSIGIEQLKNDGFQIVIGKWKTPPAKKDLIKAVKGEGYTALLTLLTDPVDAELLDAVGPQLKIVSNYAVGFNNINLDDASKRGVVIANTPGTSSDAVAEHTYALILALTTKLVPADNFTRRGKYSGWDPMIFIGTDVKGKTLGLVGAGQIGERVARIGAKGFGMKVIYHDIKKNETLETEDGAIYVDTIEDVIKEADIVSLHVPLDQTTYHLMNGEHFKMMKKTALLINTSRGPVIDEGALVAALKAGLIAGAGLDVYEFEPKITKDLLKMDNVVVTPHIASARMSARNSMSELAAKNIIDTFAGREPKGIIH